MACGGCRNGSGSRHTGTGASLKQFAFLSPAQLRLLKELEAAEAAKKAAEEESKE
jgi:hypothetical protein